MAISIDTIQKPIPVTIQSAKQNVSRAHFKYIPKPYIKVARGMEKQYVKFMIDQMNKTVKKSDGNSNGQNYYNSLLDNKRVDTIVNNKEGLGLQKVILAQIYPERFRNKFAYTQYEQTTQNKYKHKKNIQMVGPRQPITKHTEIKEIYGPNATKESSDEKH